MSVNVEDLCLDITAELDDDDVITEDTDGEGLGSEDEYDTASSANSEAVLNQSQKGRIFMVERVEKASGGYRPNFLFSGGLYDIHSDHEGSHVLAQVRGTKELQLSLRYEPPSPKFSRSMQGMASYRLKLLHGPSFLYLLRGLPKTLLLDRAAKAVGWGALQLVFHTSSQLDSFLAALRHVDVEQEILWPNSISALWCTASDNEGAPQTPSEAASSTTTTAARILERLVEEATSRSASKASSLASAGTQPTLPGPQPLPTQGQHTLSTQAQPAQPAVGSAGAAEAPAAAEEAESGRPWGFFQDRSSNSLMLLLAVGVVGVAAYWAHKRLQRTS